MILAIVEGTVVATKKNPRLTGNAFRVVRPLSVDPASGELKAGSGSLVAVDAVGSGEGQTVLVAQGSSARLAMPDKDSPVDAVIVGIVDTVDVGRKVVFRAQ